MVSISCVMCWTDVEIEEKIDLSSVDLWSLPVKKLKKILTGWGENCRGCVEKGDLIAKINKVKELHIELWFIYCIIFIWYSYQIHF